MAGKGFDYYRNSYTHEQLWEMLVTQGDAWSVEQAGSVWTTAKGGLESARDQLDASMLETVDYWQGPASEEFQRRMRLVYEYSQTAEEDMMQAAEQTIPGIAQDLVDAQSKAQNQDLSPASELEYEDWLEEVKQVKPEDPDYLEKQEQYRTEYEQYKTDRHDAIAKIVADLGDRYSEHKSILEDPPAPPPSDMPGNSTYQPPTGGVFGNDGMNSASSMSGAPGIGSESGPGSGIGDGTGSGGGIENSDLDDLDPVDGWEPGSYDDLDSDISGGLAGGGPLAPVGGGGFSGGGGGFTATGGGFTSAGTGLFGPAAGGGSGSTSSRGPGTNSPARSGAAKSTTGPSNTRGSGSGGRGGTNPTSGRGAGRGMGRGMGPNGGTRSGYHDDDEEEETTRETWLKEDDMNWSANRTPEEEVDD
ncbi:WXG100 family type VII secretion target [Glycomyces tarimensis]